MVKYDLPRFRAFKREGRALRRGRYSSEENRRLVQNVKDFLALTGIDSGTKLFFPSRFPEEKSHIVKMKNQYKFHSRMAAGICRPWHDIYTRGRKIFDEYNYKGRFTEEDDNKLRKLQKLHGNNWMKISELTGRSNHSLELRFSQLAANKGAWTEEELASLTRAVRCYMQQLAEPVGDSLTIRRERLYSKLPWTEVASQVQTRNWSQCRIKWMAILKQKMTAGAQVYRGRKSLEAKIRLIKALHAMNVEDAAEVNWEDLTQAIGDVPPNYVQSKFYKLKVTQVPLWQTMSFGDVIDFLNEKVVPQLEQRLQACRGHSRDEEEEEEGVSTQQETFLFSDIFGDESEMNPETGTVKRRLAVA
ncbi:transcription termination factor 1 [Megalops cyprinoides]|uniref:transcription termination factor 1 n=1 Tax=Megalops cyprinoides TaxID=118141 RepID=UPI001863EA39|nr:transcription termination factor 1 [Megalops cyprinoides]